MTTTLMTDYWTELQAVNAVQAILKGPGRPTGFGDSLTFYLWNIWGLGNQMAFPGATSGDLLANITAWNNADLRDVGPSCAFLMIGTNDAIQGSNGSDGTFLANLGALTVAIRQFLPDPAKLAFCTIPPVEVGKAFDAPAILPNILALNTIIQAGAAAEARAGRPLVLLDTYAVLAGSDGYALPGSTYDGVHFWPACAAPVQSLITNQITAWNA